MSLHLTDESKQRNFPYHDGSVDFASAILILILMVVLALAVPIVTAIDGTMRVVTTIFTRLLRIGARTNC